MTFGCRCRAALAVLLVQVGTGCSSRGDQATLEIRGTVLPAWQTSIYLEGPVSRSTFTRADGQYTFANLVPGTYTVTPFPMSATVTPPKRTVQLANGAVGGQDFALSALPLTHYENPLPQANALRGVWGTGPDDVWAVGDRGTFIRWDGASWTIPTPRPAGSAAEIDLTSVWAAGPRYFATSAKGFVYEWQGILGRSTFVYASPGSGQVYSEPIWCVRGTDAANRFMTGVAGATWYGGLPIVAHEPGADAGPALYSMWTLGPAETWAVGAAGKIFRFDPDTLSWSAVPSATTSTLRGAWGSAANDVWAVGDGGATVHWDGGAWSPVAGGTSSNLFAVWGFGANDVWAVGARGTILRWEGVAWAAVPSTTSRDLFAAWGSGPDDLWVVGDEGVILRWNGGAWSNAVRGSVAILNGVWGSGADVWAVGQGGTILRRNGGAWAPVDSGAAQDLNGVWGLEGEAWAVGDAGTVLHWDGSAWQPTASGTSRDLLAIWGSGRTDFWAVGAAGTILHFTDGSWHQTTVAAGDLHGIWGSSANDVWALSNSMVLHWDGAAWSQALPTGGRGIGGRGPDDVWVVGGTFLTPSVDHYDGDTWSWETPPGGTISGPLNAVWGSADAGVWAVADDGSILRWDPEWPGSGTGWSASSIRSDSSRSLRAVWGNSAYEVWAVGDGGTVLRWGEGETWFY